MAIRDVISKSAIAAKKWLLLDSLGEDAGVNIGYQQQNQQQKSTIPYPRMRIRNNCLWFGRMFWKCERLNGRNTLQSIKNAVLYMRKVAISGSVGTHGSPFWDAIWLGSPPIFMILGAGVKLYKPPHQQDKSGRRQINWVHKSAHDNVSVGDGHPWSILKSGAP